MRYILGCCEFFGSKSFYLTVECRVNRSYMGMYHRFATMFFLFTEFMLFYCNSEDNERNHNFLKTAD